MGNREAPQGIPVDREGAAVDRKSVGLESAVGLGMFVERCLVAVLEPGERHDGPGWAVCVDKALR